MLFNCFIEVAKIGLNYKLQILLHKMWYCILCNNKDISNQLLQFVWFNIKVVSNLISFRFLNTITPSFSSISPKPS